MSKINGLWMATALVVFAAGIAVRQDPFSLRGYRTGRYLGDASNAANKGRVTFDITDIGGNGATKAHFSATGGLYGEAELTGLIDESGVLNLHGMLSGFAMSVVGRVSNNTIQADFHLKSSFSEQDGKFTATLTSDADTQKKALLATGKYKGQACFYDAPAGPVSRTAQASEKTFKLVLNNWFNLDARPGGTTNPLQVGVMFLEFQMNTPFVNSARFDGLTGSTRLHDGAPVGATIYPVNTTYIHCARYRGTTERRVSQQNFKCFQDKFNDWTCSVDSYAVNLEKISIPD